MDDPREPDEDRTRVGYHRVTIAGKTESNGGNPGGYLVPCQLAVLSSSRLAVADRHRDGVHSTWARCTLASEPVNIGETLGVIDY